jgi:beta-lactamase class A
MRKNGPDLLRWISVSLLLAALALVFFELVAFSRQRANLPRGLTIAGVSVGGLDQATASQRLLQAYSMPVELHYGDQVIMLVPAAIGFRLDTEAMMAAAELARTGDDFWADFWNYLWNRPATAQAIPLRSEYSPAQLEAALRDIGARYDNPPTPVLPIPGSPNFQPGRAGSILDIARASELIGELLAKPSNRRLNLPVVASQPGRPGLPTLATLLKQNIDVAGFDGLAVVYVADLRTGDEIEVGRYQNADISLKPDIAFTAASTIKIGIMTAFYRYFDGPLDPEADRWLTQMITLSGNDPADWLMQRIDRLLGPIKVTDTLKSLGLGSSFIAGYFHLGSELLRDYQTPGNSRPDINTSPDRYNQTTASDMGMLLTDVYQCANGGGTLLAAFPGQIKQAECQHMLELLSGNKIGVLIEAGVPDGTRVAHKHGWTDSPLTQVSDAGIVFSPAGDFVVSIFLWNSHEMIWEPSSKLVAELARATYNYFNPPTSPGIAPKS